MGSYGSNTRLDQNAWITDPTVPDPDNLPQPLGWTVLIRPYGIKEELAGSGLLMPTNEIDFMNYSLNIGRVVAIGPCCWNRPEHKNVDGERFAWVKVGDFVAYPKNVGAKRKFKGVSYLVMTDDDLLEYLPDPKVFDETRYQLDIPQEHLEKYNTVYKKESV